MKWSELPTPCYVVDEALIEENLKVLRGVMERTGARILLAQKAFSMYALYPLISRYLCGATASGLYEARLCAEEMTAPFENHIYSPAFREEDFGEILKYSDHIVFNSWRQVEKFGERAKHAGKSIGLRVNPECSTQEGHAIYDPCAPGSRLGVTAQEFVTGLDTPEGKRLLPLLDGIHFHTLCEQNSDDLEKTLDAVEEKFGKYLADFKWINFGGGHHITRQDYDIPRLEHCIRRMQEKYGLTVYIEPGEAVALNAGFLVTTVLETRRMARLTGRCSGLPVWTPPPHAICPMCWRCPTDRPCATAGTRERKLLPIVWAGLPVWRGTLSVTTPLTESWRRGTGWFLRTWRSTPW